MSNAKRNRPQPRVGQLFSLDFGYFNTNKETGEYIPEKVKARRIMRTIKRVFLNGWIMDHCGELWRVKRFTSGWVAYE